MTDKQLSLFGFEKQKPDVKPSVKLTAKEHLSKCIGVVPEMPSKGNVVVKSRAGFDVFVASFGDEKKTFIRNRQAAKKWLEECRERWHCVWDDDHRKPKFLIFLYGNNPNVCFVRTHSTSDNGESWCINREYAVETLINNGYYYHSNHISHRCIGKTNDMETAKVYHRKEDVSKRKDEYRDSFGN